MSDAFSWIIPYAQHFSYGGIFSALVLTSVGFPIPEDIILLTAGFIAAEGYANIYIMLALTMVAILGGDSVMYWLGRRFGETIFQFRWFRKIFTLKRQARVQAFYQNHGKKTIFIARFAPGLRAGVYIMAGGSRMGFLRFLLTDSAAAILSVPLLVWLGYALAPHIERVAHDIKEIKLILLVLVLLVILGIIIYRNSKRKKQD